MACSVVFTRTLALWPRAIFLQWDLVDPTVAGTHLITVSRSGSPEGPWTALVSSQPDLLFYEDVVPVGDPGAVVWPVHLLNLSKQVWYRVDVTAPDLTTAYAVSAIEPGLEPKLALVRRKIRRDVAIMLSRLEGTQVAVCKRKHWGTLCTSGCRDKYTRTSVRSHDPVCLGTGFVSGYYEPIYTWAKREPRTVAPTLSPQGGKSERVVLQVTMLDYPLLQDDDVIVFLRDNRRFLVERLVTTELRLTSVTQVVEVTEIPRDAIEYKISVDPTRTPRFF